MKSKLILAISSLLLALGLTACPPGQGTPGTSGQINATFSNPSGTTGITLEPFSAGASTVKTSMFTHFIGVQGNRVIQIQFAPPLSSNIVCPTAQIADTPPICVLWVGKSGEGPFPLLAKGGTVTATLSGGNVNITANGAFSQKDGVTFDVEVNATIPYTP
jgi:hypothetical protein